MSFGDHLDDLRKRLVLALLGPIPALIVCLVYGAELLEFLLAPVETQLRAAELPARLLATSPMESFAAYLKVGIAASLLIATPWIFYQAWLFVAPGLYTRERRFVYFLLPLSALLTAGGAVFLYTILLPVSLRFLILFGAQLAPMEPGTLEGATAPPPGPAVEILPGDPATPDPGSMWFNERLNELRIAIPRSNGGGGARVVGVPVTGGGAIAQQFRISEYVNLVFVLGVVFAIAFQLPIVLLLLGWTGMVTPESLTPHRRYIAFGCAVAGAVLTPADPISMALLSLPLYLLFELGVLLMRFIPARRVGGEERGS